MNFYKENPSEINQEWYQGLSEDEKHYLENHWNNSVRFYRFYLTFLGKS